MKTQESIRVRNILIIQYLCIRTLNKVLIQMLDKIYSIELLQEN